MHVCAYDLYSPKLPCSHCIYTLHCVYARIGAQRHETCADHYHPHSLFMWQGGSLGDEDVWMHSRMHVPVCLWCVCCFLRKYLLISVCAWGCERLLGKPLPSPALLTQLSLYCGGELYTVTHSARTAAVTSVTDVRPFYIEHQNTCIRCKLNSDDWGVELTKLVFGVRRF